MVAVSCWSPAHIVLRVTVTVYLMLCIRVMVVWLELVVAGMGPDRGAGLIPIVTAIPLVGGAHSMVTVDRPTPCVDLPTRKLLGGPVVLF